MKKLLLLSIAIVSLPGSSSLSRADEDKKSDRPVVKPAEDVRKEIKLEKPKSDEKSVREAPTKKPVQQTPAIERQLEEMHRHLKELSAAGRTEEAGNVKRKIGELMQHKGHQPAHSERSEHVKIATQRLLEAAEHLKAAGLQEPAENLTRMAHDIREHHLGDHAKESPNKRHPEEEELQIKKRSIAIEREGLDDRLHDLTNLVKQLHERMERLEKSGNKNRDRD